MRYRTHPKTGDKISEIGMGSAYLYEAEHDEAIATLRTAYEGGINYFDLAAGDGLAFTLWGEALADVRKQLLYQVHFGADYSKGTYGWSQDFDIVKRSVEWQLRELKTDYIDYGFIHCQDEMADWETYQKNGVYRYIQSLQEQGVVRHLGLSSHTPAVIQRILDEVPVDMLMFSINPAYDYGHGEFANGGVSERAGVYTRCQKDGIGISVMKPFSGGQLLDVKQSPFGKVLTPYQCIRYALDKPGVMTVLPGAQSVAEVKTLLAYEQATEGETDYSVIASFAPICGAVQIFDLGNGSHAVAEATGKCVYCNHCKPCPQGLDIGLINKYYDLARAGDTLAAEHYRTLEKTAADCVHCGHCDRRCPFGVKQSDRMKEIDRYMDGGL